MSQKNPSMTEKFNLILERAKELSKSAKSWTEFADAVSNQRTGLVATILTDPMEKQAFYDSPEYEKLSALRQSIIEKLGVVDGVGAPKSGKMLLRLPKTLHSSLESEAKREGVSLNQLAVSKLSVTLRDATKIDLQLVARAFEDVRDGYSTERVVLDPNINPEFLARCKKLGVTHSEYKLNHAIFNIRKNVTRLGIRLSETTKETTFRDYDDYQFGAEISARILERTEGVTLDRVLCDPEFRRKYDFLCLPLVHERSVLKLRYAALNLRKTCRLRPADIAAGPQYDLVSAGPVAAIDMSALPAMHATYVFYDQNRPIYAGETANLRKRVGIHLEPGRLPEWINTRAPGFTLRYFVVTTSHQKDRLAWVRQFINTERPLLNYQEVA